jgi:hypothetical protein
MSTVEAKGNEGAEGKTPLVKEHDQNEPAQANSEPKDDQKPKLGNNVKPDDKSNKTPEVDEQDDGFTVTRPSNPKDQSTNGDNWDEPEEAPKPTSQTNDQEKESKKSKKKDKPQDPNGQGKKAPDQNPGPKGVPSSSQIRISEEARDLYRIPNLLEFVSIVRKYYMITLPRLVLPEVHRDKKNAGVIKLFEDVAGKLERDAKLANRIEEDTELLSQFKKINEVLEEVDLAFRREAQDTNQKLRAELDKLKKEHEKILEEREVFNDQVKNWRTFNRDFIEWEKLLPESIGREKEWIGDYTVTKVRPP